MAEPHPYDSVWERVDEALWTAITRGDLDGIAARLALGSSPNDRDGQGRNALHHALVAPVSPTLRAAVVEELLRGLAVPELRDHAGTNAYALAESVGERQVIEVLRRDGLRHGPRQCREARARDIRDIRVHYDKANGLIYRVGVPNRPFLFGGAYDGCLPMGTQWVQQWFPDLAKDVPAAAPFEPFLARVVFGEEFPLEEVLALFPDHSGFSARTSWPR